MYKAYQLWVHSAQEDWPYSLDHKYMVIECEECGSTHFFSHEKVMKGA